MDNSILFKEGPRLVRCDGCGGYFESEELKECRICGNRYCPECRKTHDCRTQVNQPNPNTPPMHNPNMAQHECAEQNTQPTIILGPDEAICDGCGKKYNKSDLKKCRTCGAVLCPFCRSNHKCSQPKDTSQQKPVSDTGSSAPYPPQGYSVPFNGDSSQHQQAPSYANSQGNSNYSGPNSAPNYGQSKRSGPPVRSDGVVVTGHKSPAVAVILGFLIIGVGLMYAGRVGKGFLYLILSIVLCWTVITPLVLWILGMVKACKLCKENNLLWMEYMRGN